MNINEILGPSAEISLNDSTPAAIDFCKLWPGAKQALQALQAIVKDPVAKAVLGIAILAGDTVSGKVCPAADK